VESRLLGFPCFPYSVISMACFGNGFHKVTTTKTHFGDSNDLSEMPTSMCECVNVKTLFIT
jgi:hypothetical protein